MARRPFITQEEEEQEQNPRQGLLSRGERPQVQLGGPINMDSLQSASQPPEPAQRSQTGLRLGAPIDTNELHTSTIAKDAETLPDVTQEALDYYDPDHKNPEVGRLRSSVNSFMMGLTQIVPNAIKTKALIEAKIYQKMNEVGVNDAIAAFLVAGFLPTSARSEAQALDMYKAGEKVGGFLQELFPENSEYQSEFWAGTIARGAGQLTGQVAASIATGGLGGGAMAVLGVNTAMTATLGAQYYEEAVAEGADEDKAFEYMLYNIAGNSAINALPMALMMHRVNKATGGSIKNLAKAGFKGSIEEGLTEGVQQWYSNMTAIEVYGSTRDLMDGVLEGMAAGAILGATANVATNALVGDRMRTSDIERMLEIDRALSLVDQQVKAGVMPNESTPKQTVRQINDKLDPEFKEGQRPKTAVVATDGTIAQNKPVKRVEERTAWERWKNKKWDWFPTEEGLGRIIDKGKSEFSAELRRAQLYVADLVEAVYNEAGLNSPSFRDTNIGKLMDDGHIDKDLGRKIDEALKDKKVLANLPEGLQAPVNNLRKHIDYLSNELVRRGFISTEMQAEFSDNLGVYLHRSYRLHDGKWDETTIPKELWNITENKFTAMAHQQLKSNPKKFKKFLEEIGFSHEDMKLFNKLSYKQQRVISKGVAEAMMHDILSGGGESSVQRIGQMLNAPPTKDQKRKALMDKKTVGAKALGMETETGILKKREPIPEFIREFMGEYHDGTLNYVRSVEYLAGLMARRTMFDSMKSAYGGSLFLTAFEKNQTEHRTDYVKIDSGLKSDVDGMFVHKELLQKMMHDPIANTEGSWIEYAAKFNMAAKFSKTVLSHVTVIRNVTGGLMFIGFNGHMPSPKAVNFAWNRARVAFMTDPMISKSKKKEHWQKLTLEYARLNLPGKSVRAGELQRSAQEAGLEQYGAPQNFVDTQNLLERIMTRPKQSGKHQGAVGQFIGKWTRRAGDFYRAGDDFVRILFYELELARNERYNIYDPQTRKEQTANDVLNFYQNYDRVGQMWDAPRRFPLMAPFVSFPAEVTRTMYNTGERIYQDINSGDAGRQSVGYQRLGGVFATFIGITAAAAASQLLHDITDDDDRAYREFMPPWDKNSTIIYTSAERGKVRYINTSYTNPYAYFMDTFTAITKGADSDTVIDRSIAGLKELFSPLLGEEIFAQAAREAVTNVKTGGGEVYNPQDVIGDKMQKIMLHMWNAFEPGTLTSAQRTIEPFTNDKSEKQASDELMGLFGLRLITVDIKDSFGFSIRSHRQDVRDARRVYNAMKFNEDASLKDRRDALQRANKSYENTFQKMSNLIDAAQSTGTSWEDLEAIMKDSGLAQRDIAALRKGVFKPFDE